MVLLGLFDSLQGYSLQQLFVKKLAMRLAGLTQQTGEETQTFVAKVPEKVAMRGANGFIELRQEFQAFRRNAGHDCPPVLAFAATGDQGALLEAVEEPGNIRVPGDHAVADLTAGKPFRGAAQNPQDVVLRRCQLRGLHDLAEMVRQSLGGPHHFKKRDFLGTGAGLWFEVGLESGFHL